MSNAGRHAMCRDAVCCVCVCAPHLDGWCGGDEAHKLCEDQLDLVNLSRHKVGKDLVSNGLGLTGGGGGTKAERLCHAQQQVAATATTAGAAAVTSAQCRRPVR